MQRGCMKNGGIYTLSKIRRAVTSKIAIEDRKTRNNAAELKRLKTDSKRRQRWKVFDSTLSKRTV